MKREISISITKPCSENWSNFDSTATGGFCKSCNKNVIDFTTASDDEIFLYFKNKPVHTCGKFRPSQLKTYTSPIVQIAPGFPLLKAGLFSFLLLFICQSASAQSIVKVKTTTERIQQLRSRKSQAEVLPHDFSVKGVVISRETKLPIGNLTVMLKGTNIGTSTDDDGQFEFKEKFKYGDILVFSTIGMESVEYQLYPEILENERLLGLEISMVLIEEIVWMGEVSVDGVYSSDHGWLKNAWIKLKGIF